MMVRSQRWFFAFAIFAGFALASIDMAQAQMVPFKIVGGGQADYIPVEPGDSADHDATGLATHLGRYFGEGAVLAGDMLPGPTLPGAIAAAEFKSAEPFVFYAANGDALAFDYGRGDGPWSPGIVNLFFVGMEGENMIVYALFDAEFTPVPEESTGRFADVVDGSFRMIAVTEPFVFGDTEDDVRYWWSGRGWIAFD